MTLLKATLLSAVIGGSLTAQATTLEQGPLIGHVDTTSAQIWARSNQAGEFVLTAQSITQKQVSAEAKAIAKYEHDYCMVFSVEGLKPDQNYAFSVATADGVQLCDGADYVLQTAAKPTADGNVSIMFGSCCYEDEGTGETWEQVSREQPNVVVLLGDSPYIDNTNLKHQRKRYAAFAKFAPMASVLRKTAWYGTWDDHDFGGNDTDGRLRGQANSRQAFIEYHANPSYGDGQRGIYTKFRRGPIEVFLLDTRTFAATEPSPFLRHHASLLGSKQWSWLLANLKKSTAPIKVLACGMIWNEATRPNKQDHWGSYPHERSALFDAIGKHKISGVVLVGGDIHRSRVVRHDTKISAGYNIIELISSPMHHSIIASANAPHPGLIKDMGEPHTFLLLKASQKKGRVTALRAHFKNADGEEHFTLDLLK